MAMPDVLQFPVPKSVDETKGRPCLLCDCGSMAFNLMMDGALECAKCDIGSSNIGWFYYDPNETAS